MAQAQSFTGRTRRRQTRWTVKAIDRLSSAVITVGGVGAIVAVLAVCVFLMWVALPLFWPAQLGPPQAMAVHWPGGEAPTRLRVNDGHNLACGWFPQTGALQATRLDNGLTAPIAGWRMEPKITSASLAPSGALSAIGRADGAVSVGRLEFTERDYSAQELPSEVIAQLDARPGELVDFDGGLVERKRQGGYRRHGLDFGLLAIPAEQTAAIRLIDAVERGAQQLVATVVDTGEAKLLRIRRGADGEADVRTIDLPYEADAAGAAPWRVMLSGLGDSVFLAWEDGRLIRFAVQAGKAHVAETIDLTPQANAKLTALEWLAGRSTLVAGDSQGNVGAWFTAREEDQSGKPVRLVHAHRFPAGPGGVTALDASGTQRTIAIGYADGTLRLMHVTSGKLLAEGKPLGPSPLETVVLNPKNDALIVMSSDRAAMQTVDLRHPEANLASLFSPVWYEGYSQPEHVWQSSSGSDDFEPKLGFWPLVFGTLKATFYSLLFAVPISLLAAVYTSEFMRPAARLRVKPLVELMASLPSVVLGFLAGLILAPWVESQLPAVLLAVGMAPVGWMLGARLWQLLPMSVSLRLPQLRIVGLALALAVSLLTAWQMGPWLERQMFNGDAKLWLSGGDAFRSTWGGWCVLLVCPAALAVGWITVRHVNPLLQRRTAAWSRASCAVAELVKFLAAVVATLLIAALGAMVLERIGGDPRGSLVGGYDQRNALVVGFVMGFAIVPIIYTIAEDALSSVPEHLRSAALGAGATPWQTAVTVVIPTAMSGLFSAIMVGLGRAVGETMIVLMAAGNTPVMDWNIFNGFRTLAANIAVEIAEAPQNSTHYRTLFLAALTLFAMTFVINSLAEWVRQRFRRRAYQL